MLFGMLSIIYLLLQSKFIIFILEDLCSLELNQRIFKLGP
jgi:hypothetical protein